jgi:hypothetical protein
MSEDEDESFNDVRNYGRSNGDDALEAYLSAPTSDDDAIPFWTSRLDAPGAPVTSKGALARMGLDFASAPGSYLVASSVLHY